MLCEISQPFKIDSEDVKALEKEILLSLDFEIQFPTMYRFYQMFCQMVKAPLLHRTFGNFFLEITMLETRMISQYKASLLAISALNLVSQRIVN